MDFSDRDQFESEFQLVGDLGEGAEGTIQLWEHSVSGQKVVVKEFFDDVEVDGVPWTSKEPQNLGRLNHPNIIKKLGEHDRRMILEYCAGGDLRAYKNRSLEAGRRIPESFVWSVFHQLLSAVSYLHSGHGGRPVCHRDIKPGNILLQRRNGGLPVIKLADFGSANFHPNDHLENVNGSQYWQPPEYPPTGPKHDMWGIGAVIHFLCLGEPPVDQSDRGLLDDETGYPKKVTAVNSSPPACSPSPLDSDEDESVLDAYDEDDGNDGSDSDLGNDDGDEGSLNGEYSDALEYFVAHLLTFDPKKRATGRGLLALMHQIYTATLNRCNDYAEFPRIVDEVFKEMVDFDALEPGDFHLP